MFASLQASSVFRCAVQSWVLTVCAVAFAISQSPQSLAQEPDDVPHILFLTQSKGFVHGSVNRRQAERSPAELALMQLAKDSGEFTIRCSQDAAADFTEEELSKYDIVAFYTSGDLPIAPETFDYFLKKWLPQKGHGVLGFHSAGDTFKNFEPYWDLMGGCFNGHPWTARHTVTMKIHDTDHPGMKAFGEKYVVQDEIYQYYNWQPEKVRVLMSLDMEDTELKRPYHVPVAWCKQIGEGRLFYNNMGHREETWKNKDFLNSIVAAVRWIRGKEQGSAEPNPKVSEQQHEDSVRFSKLAGVTPESLAAEEKAKQKAAAARRAAQEKKAKKK